MESYALGSEENVLKTAISLAILNPRSAAFFNIIGTTIFKIGERTDCLKFYDHALKNLIRSSKVAL